MKKINLALSLVLFAACSAQTPPVQHAEVALVPPHIVKSGYLKLAQDAEYYVDTSSIWVDNEDKRLVHFDAVINSDKGLFVYKDRPELYAKSIRQYKILNCETHRLTQIRTDYYTEFWGDGIRAAPKRQEKYTVTLKKNSSLYVLSQVICANIHRSW